MTNDQIKHMVNRFLAWRLPKDFNPDNGVSAQRPNYAPEVEWGLTGTNLFDAAQAEEMVRHMIDGMPINQANQQNLRPPSTRPEKGSWIAIKFPLTKGWSIVQWGNPNYSLTQSNFDVGEGWILLEAPLKSFQERAQDILSRWQCGGSLEAKALLREIAEKSNDVHHE